VRVAVDVSPLFANWGGIPKYLLRVVEGLVGAGDQVELVANARRSPHQVHGAPYVPLRFKGMPVWREAVLPGWLSVRRPDVFWAPGSRLPRLLPVPAVVTVHDLAPILFAGSKSVTESRLFDDVLPRSARQARRVIAVSETTARDARSLWQLDAERIRVVPLGVDERFTPGDVNAADAEVTARYGLTGAWILAVGSLEPRKGIDLLVETARAARALGRPWRVVLVGRPAFGGEALAESARAAGCLVLDGVDDDDLVLLYRAAKLLVVPSLYEGFGLTPLEAMACGTPAVIAAGSGGLEEISGAAAVVVPERTPEAWLAAIEQALANRERLVAPALAHAGRFTWERTVAATRDVLAEAAADSPRRPQKAATAARSDSTTRS
jgi:glycosyltransferase involved in cell wall biosynthesis